MSTFEQMIVFWNSLSVYGQPLRDSGIIEEFRLIKNIPHPLMDFCGGMKQYYPGLEGHWEWDEIVARTKQASP